jgi:hypothetical protein
VRLNGAPIDDYAIRAPAAMITTTLEFEEEQARIAAGLTMEAYGALPGIPVWCGAGERSKAHILIWYRMSQRIPAAANDAQARKMEREMKAKRR